MLCVCGSMRHKFGPEAHPGIFPKGFGRQKVSWIPSPVCACSDVAIIDKIRCLFAKCQATFYPVGFRITVAADLVALTTGRGHYGESANGSTQFSNSASEFLRRRLCHAHRERPREGWFLPAKLSSDLPVVVVRGRTCQFY
jgi:hypothetical protein